MLVEIPRPRKLPRFGYIDREGKVVIAAKYKAAMSFSEGLAAVRDRRKWVFLDKTGKIVIRTDAEQVTPFSGGFAGFKLLAVD